MIRLPANVALLFAVFTASFAQSVPPGQNYAAVLSQGPFKAPATADFAPGGSFTMEGWFYLTGNLPYAWLMGKGLASSGVDPYVSFALQLNGDGTKPVFATSTGAAGSYRELVGSAALPLRTWVHLAATMENGSATRLFVNGQQVAAGTSAGAPLSAPTVPFGVGSAYLPSGATNYSPFPGYARQVRFWNVARSSAQILPAMSECLPSSRSGLVAAWPLDEGSGTAARDLSGAGRALAGGGGWIRLSLLEAGLFFNVTPITPAGNVLGDVDDACVIDFDSDGYPDLVTRHITWPPTVPETRRRLRAFRNDRKGGFTDVTDAVLGNVTMVHPRHHFVGDFNGDGRPDLLIVGHGTDTVPFPGEQTKLLIQTADGRLVDETASRLPAHLSFTHNVAVADIDGDGDLDIYMSNVFGGDSGPRFYINNGKGFFTEATDRVPAEIANRALTAPNTYAVFTAAALVDVNGDGFPDLVLGAENTYPINELLLNDGTGRFARRLGFTLPAKLISARAATVHITSADLNGDGAVDLLLSTTGGSVTLPDGRTIDGYSVPAVQMLLNRGDGTFYDATAQLNLGFGPTDSWIEWIRVADLNGDGKPDLVLQGAPTSSGGAFSKSILLNRGGAVFVDASEAYAGGSVTFLEPMDVDRDGLIDLVGLNPTAIVVSRATKRLDRAPFETAPDEPGRLANLSVRTQAGTGDQTLIAGFALGSGTSSKPLLVRAIGPTLGAFGLTGTLVDPLVEIAPLGGAKLAENNDWGGTAALKNAFASLGAFGLAADGSKDAALLFSPTVGAYTAKVTGANGGTGVALVEVYDAGTGNSPRLTNVSARTQVGTGANALIVGFVVDGNLPKKLLIRASGPTLAAFGLGGTLADPVLELRPLGSDNVVAVNDDWRGTTALKSAFASVGAFGFASDTSKDAALAIELPPGAYTATVTGKNSTTGVALVEVYELP